MSWWISYSSKDDFANDVRATGSVADADVTDEAKEQIKAARDAAEAIIDGGSAGASGKDFTVSLNGHANTGHDPAPGWANDCVGINVTQKS